MAVFAAIYNFVGAGDHKLTLDVGDAVNIICQSDGMVANSAFRVYLYFFHVIFLCRPISLHNATRFYSVIMNVM